MNQSVKNVFSFIKEVLELKNKNIYDVNQYEKYYDLGTFYNKYKEILGDVDYSDITVFSNKIVFKLKYIKEDKKKKYPEVPPTLSEYIYLNSDHNIIDKVDNLEELLNTHKDLFKAYNQYVKDINFVDNYNELISKYNQTYMDLYNIYKRINDLEEKIEIILGTNLLIWKDGNGNSIARHALEANLDISVDSISNSISLSVNQDKFKGLVMDFFNLESFKVKDYVSLSDQVKYFNQLEDSENINIKFELEKYLNFACLENEVVDGEFDSKEEYKTNCLYAFDNIGIIVRNKSIKLWIEDLEKIIDACDNTKFNSPILNLLEADFENEVEIKELLNDSTYKNTKDDAVLFPLPSNDEQYEIVDKVRSSKIVLVQGPPGTGKSHTIANLLSHYVSQGKKVIVTSEKGKALEVLREKIPEEIRSLSLSLLTNTGVDRDLEYSVETILRNQMDEKQQELVYKRVEELTSDLKKIYTLKQQNQHEIISLMAKDTVSHRAELNELMDFAGDNKMSLMDIAVWLNNNKQYDVISLNDVENYNYVYLDDFFAKLDNICDEIRDNKYALNGCIPLYESLETNKYELAINENIKFKNYLPKYPQLIKCIKQENISSDTLSRLEQDINRLSTLYNVFDKKTLYENSDYVVFNKNIADIRDKILNQQEFIFNVEEKMIEYDIKYQEEKCDEYHKNLKLIIDLYDGNETIKLFDKMKLNKYLKKLQGLTINGLQLSKDNVSKEKVTIAAQRLYYQMFVDELESDLSKVLKIDLFGCLHIDKKQFGKYKNKVIELLNTILDFKKICTSIDKQFDTLVNRNLFEIDYIDKSEEEINNIISDMSYYLEININNNKTSSYANDLRAYYKDYNLQNLSNVISAIESNNETELIDSKNKLIKEINIINSYNSLKNIFGQFMNDKSNLINDYIYNYTNEEKIFLKKNTVDILKYHYIHKFYKALESAESVLPELYSTREKLIRKEKELIKQLVVTQGWYYQSKTMTPAISNSLSKWMQLKKKRGAGTGKNAQILLRQMREEMSIAKNAIPVWIMPIDRLIEQYPFDNEPIFDVLIMDESSQSSVFSISALTRAKKIIIVGDDKQISPTNAFQNVDDINDLIFKHLKNSSWKYQISKDTSIYDFVQMICLNKKVTLSEHFRCLPEIIHYSNKEFYNMQINPLKVRGINETIEKPILVKYVPNAYVTKSGSQYYNDAEINRIVSLVGEILHDHQYDNKTIGIISLQNSSKHIQKLDSLIGIEYSSIIKDRKIKIGNTYDFQGDERDVIILSMLIAPITDNGEKYNFKAMNTEEFNRSFNVAASRAKEQMILVHSVKLEELNPICNRYKLLKYCMTYNDEKQQEAEKLFESDFERDIYYLLDSKGFKLIPQFKVGKYRLDFVVENNSNQKIVIECDGDTYHGLEQLESDLERQTVLERCGWKFIRIRASEFYYEKEKTVNRIINELTEFLESHISHSEN